jgi:hypothetical protein
MPLDLEITTHRLHHHQKTQRKGHCDIRGYHDNRSGVNKYPPVRLILYMQRFWREFAYDKADEFL